MVGLCEGVTVGRTTVMVAVSGAEVALRVGALVTVTGDAVIPWQADTRVITIQSIRMYLFFLISVLPMFLEHGPSF